MQKVRTLFCRSFVWNLFLPMPHASDDVDVGVRIWACADQSSVGRCAARTHAAGLALAGCPRTHAHPPRQTPARLTDSGTDGARASDPSRAVYIMYLPPRRARRSTGRRVAPGPASGLRRSVRRRLELRWRLGCRPQRLKPSRIAAGHTCTLVGSRSGRRATHATRNTCPFYEMLVSSSAKSRLLSLSRWMV